MKLRQLVDSIKLVDWPFKMVIGVGPSVNEFSVSIMSNDFNGSGRKWVVSKTHKAMPCDRENDEILTRWVWKKILMSVEHELAERFMVGNEKPFYPKH